jgi:hypothetical protein
LSKIRALAPAALARGLAGDAGPVLRKLAFVPVWVVVA